MSRINRRMFLNMSPVNLFPPTHLHAYIIEANNVLIGGTYGYDFDLYSVLFAKAYAGSVFFVKHCGPTSFYMLASENVCAFDDITYQWCMPFEYNCWNEMFISFMSQ